MSWEEECKREISKAMSEYPLREVLSTTIIKLIEAKIHAAFYHSGLGGTSYDPDQVVDYQERLLHAVIDELHKDAAPIRQTKVFKRLKEQSNEEIRRLKAAMTLAECQYLGCGGRLSPDEIVSNMRKILQEALSI